MSKFDGMTDNEVVQTIYDAIDHVRRRSVASRETDPLWQRINDLEIDNKALLERFDEAVRKLAALDLLSDGTPREVRRLKSENGGLRGALHQQTTYANQLEQEKAAGWAGRDKIDEATMMMSLSHLRRIGELTTTDQTINDIKIPTKTTS